MSNTENSTQESTAIEPELPGVGIRVGGQLVAWFADSELAQEWARDNFFGQWLSHPCSMPNRPPFSEEHLERARQEAAVLWEHLRPGKEASE